MLVPVRRKDGRKKTRHEGRGLIRPEDAIFGDVTTSLYRKYAIGFPVVKLIIVHQRFESE